MKRKIFLITAVVLLAALLVTGLVACGGKRTSHEHRYDTNVWRSDGTYHWHICVMTDGFECDEPIIDKEKCVDANDDGRCDVCQHQIMVHELTLVSAKASTCTEPGNVEYYTCSHCDKWFYDDQGATEVYSKGWDSYNHGGVYLPTHTFENGVCTVCHIPEPKDEGVYYKVEEGEDGKNYAVVQSIDIYQEGAADFVLASDFLGFPVTTIKKTVAMNKSVRSIVISDSVVTIEESAFSDCQDLESVTLGSGVQTIGISAFSGCSALDDVTFGDAIEDIGSQAFKDCAITQLTLPGSVKTIGNEAFKSSHLQKVTFSEGIKDIPAYAFSECESLTEVEFSDTVTSIGNSAFEGCGIVSLKIPAGVKKIYEAAFSNCDELQSVTLEEGVEELSAVGENALNWGSFDECDNLTSVNFPSSLTYIGAGTFHNTQLSEADLHNCTALTFIGEEAFARTQIEEIFIPNSVKTMARAFEENTKLTTVTLGTGLEDGYAAFRYCHEISDVTLPEGLKVISGQMFYAIDETLSKLTSVVIPSTVTFIGDEAFAGAAISEITIPATVKNLGIGGRIFLGCKNLTTLNWNATCDYEQNDDYYDQPALFEEQEDDAPEMTITIGAGVTKICPYLFANATIREIAIPQSVTEIGEYAFERCKNLEAIDIPAEVKTIGEYAFYDCKKLESVTLHEGLEKLGDYALCGIFANITVPTTLKEIGEYGVYQSEICNDGLTVTWNAKDCKRVKTSQEEDEPDRAPRPVLESRSSGVTLIFGEEVESFGDLLFAGMYFQRSGDYSDCDVELPAVVSIGKEAFKQTNATKFTFAAPAAVPAAEEPVRCAIGERAFEGNKNLKEISFGRSVSLGAHTFDDCSALTAVNLCGDDSEIAAGVFEGCEKLENVRFKGRRGKIAAHAFEGNEQLKSAGAAYDSANNSGSVVEIGEYAFKDCTSLTSVGIGEDGCKAGAHAFENCTKFAYLYIKFFTTIGEYAFAGCTSLNVTPTANDPVLEIGKERTTEIGDYAFKDCTGLKAEVRIYATNLKLGKGVFMGCTGLTAAKMLAYGAGDQNLEISESLFEGCTGLKTFGFSNYFTKFGDNALKDTGITNVEFCNNSVTNIQESWGKIDFGEGNEKLTERQPQTSASVMEYIYSYNYPNEGV